MPEKLIYVSEQNFIEAEQNKIDNADKNWINDINEQYKAATHPKVE